MPMDSATGATTPAHVSHDVFSELLHYFKYASSAYSHICPRPNRSHLVSPVFASSLSQIQGYVSRDESRREIIVALRGSVSVTDVLLDAQIVLIPFIAPGVKAPDGVRVHTGFLLDWNTVALEVLALVTQQLDTHPGFSIVTVGHSLGGALSTLAAVTLKANFFDFEVKTYSYGAPRVGNKAFAEFVNNKLDSRAHRVVHTNDGQAWVPTMISTSLGYHHHGVEYWQHEDPASEETTLQCSVDGEDQRCSASIPTQGVNPAHMIYFGILATTPFCI